ncbi:hypothetical protein [Mycoplana dimorpha]|uniref:DNA primase RepB-like protein n=1 Tax=Mycoplana dimorpha TaxID=28320 RepID=A0A2T5BE93_MYCDI|nr:hypothetical protein [Mycoplana dimorpha]PTM97307.1 hypothetical protein C7449_102177 [Mycoplana dimorpha]
MNITTPAAPAVQSACLGNELLALAQDSASRKLITPERAEIACMEYRVGLVSDAGLRDKLNALLADGPAPSMALDAISIAFKPGDVIELRALDPAGGRGVSLSGALDNPTQRAALEAFIREHNGKRNLYAGINPRRADLAGSSRPGKAADVVARRAVVIDLDRKDAPPTDTDWTRTVSALSVGLDPMLIVDSGNGYHVWLPIQDLSAADVLSSAGPLGASMSRLGADNMADPARIARLPFTVNVPNATKRERGAVLRMAAPEPEWQLKRNARQGELRTAADVCAALDGIAGQLGLPGKGRAAADQAAPSVALPTGETMAHHTTT